MAVTETTVANMVINTHKSKALYEKRLREGKLNDSEVHIFPEDEEKELSTTEILDIWNTIMND